MPDDAFRAWLRREYGNESVFNRQRDYLEEMAAPRHLNFDAPAFHRTFPKAIAFELEDNVEKFIREFILEESPLDVREVRAASVPTTTRASGWRNRRTKRRSCGGSAITTRRVKPPRATLLFSATSSTRCGWLQAEERRDGKRTSSRDWKRSRRTRKPPVEARRAEAESLQARSMRCGLKSKKTRKAGSSTASPVTAMQRLRPSNH